MSETGNGNGQGAEQLRRLQSDAALLAAMVQTAEVERDDCKLQFEDLQIEHRGLQAEHDALKMSYARVQNDMATYRQDRDDAVTKLAAFQAVFDAVLAVMQKHRDAVPVDRAAGLKLVANQPANGTG